MTPIKEFKVKHEEADKRLRKSIEGKKKKSVICKAVAESLNVSLNTVLNYTRGGGKDGYLKDAILNELESK